MLLVLITILGILEHLANKRASRWVQHTLEVKTQISHLLSLVTDAETGQRGYLLTGKDRYLEPHTRAVDATWQAIEKLRLKTADNSRQQNHIASLKPLVHDKYAELQQTIDLRKSGAFEQALSIVQTDLGKELMVGIRQKFQIMQEEEDRLLKIRVKRAENLAYIEFAYILLAMMTFLLVRRVLLTLNSKEKLLQDLAASNKLNATIMNSSVHMVIATDTEGTVTFFNKASEAFLGYKADDVVGKQTPQLWHDKNEVLHRAKALSLELGQEVQPGFDVFVIKPRTVGPEAN